MGNELKDNIREKIERYKILADILKKNKKSAFIKDLNYSIYFGDILEINKDNMVIECFGPQQRKGQKVEIYWYNIQHLDEYKLNIPSGDKDGF